MFQRELLTFTQLTFCTDISITNFRVTFTTTQALSHSTFNTSEQWTCRYSVDVKDIRWCYVAGNFCVVDLLLLQHRGKRLQTCVRYITFAKSFSRRYYIIIITAMFVSVGHRTYEITRILLVLSNIRNIYLILRGTVRQIILL